MTKGKKKSFNLLKGQPSGLTIREQVKPSALMLPASLELKKALLDFDWYTSEEKRIAYIVPKPNQPDFEKKKEEENILAVKITDRMRRRKSGKFKFFLETRWPNVPRVHIPVLVRKTLASRHFLLEINSLYISLTAIDEGANDND